MIQKRKKVLILYSELADYFVSCIELVRTKTEVKVVHWPVNPEAPFDFEIKNSVYVDRSTFHKDDELLEFCKKESPDVVIVSGWMDKGYLKVAKHFHGKIPTIVSMDNHWNGSIKQHVGRILSPFTLHNRFSHIWVPGEHQKEYALKLGFKEYQILSGFYAANTSVFSDAFENSKKSKAEKYPKVFLYAGRYVHHKGIFDLWNAFKAYRKEGGTWSLWCAGTGEQWPNRVKGEGIEHLGFIQPKDLPKLTTEVGAYILPSHFEPWGVAVQEMAAAGLPLLLSNRVGSLSQYLESEINGYDFVAGNEKEVTECLFKMERHSTDELLKMGEKSKVLSSSVTQQNWADTLLDVID